MIIEVGVDSIKKEDVLKRIAYLARIHGMVKCEKTYLRALQKREGEFSTECGDGIAIPHGKSDAVIQKGIIFLKLNKPILWGESEEWVDLVTTLIIPKKDFDEEYLSTISKIARALLDEGMIQKLREEQEIRNISEILRKMME